MDNREMWELCPMSGFARRCFTQCAWYIEETGECAVLELSRCIGDSGAVEVSVYRAAVDEPGAAEGGDR